MKELSVVKPESDGESDESDDGEETPDLTEAEMLVCRGEPIPSVYEDRLGSLYRREAGSLQDF